MRIILVFFIFFASVSNADVALQDNFATTDILQAHRRIYQYSIKQKNFSEPIETLKQKFLIVINTANQTLCLYQPNGVLLKSYIISTSKKGLGQLLGSYKTPIGLHKVVEKIGHNVPHYGIFRNRQFTNKVWQKDFFVNNDPQKKRLAVHKKDFIVTRILRLQGLEIGTNKGKDHQGKVVDSLYRGIYIHGTTMEWKLGKPSTIGCIHLSSQDIVELFNLVPVGCLVFIY